MPDDHTPPERRAMHAVKELALELQKLRDRVDDQQSKCTRHDYQEQDILRRLGEGNKHFAKLDKKVEELTQPTSLWKYVPWLTTVVVLIVGVIWQAARYPTWQDLRRHVQERSPYLQDRAAILKVTDAYADEMPGVRLKLGVIDYKLDTILSKLEGPQ